MRPLLILFSGVASAQAVAILVSPLLARLFSVPDFGKFSIYASVIYFVNTFSSLRLETAILAAKNEGEILATGRSAVLVLIFTVGLTYLVTTVCVKATGLVDPFYAWALPLGIFFCGTFEIVFNFSLRNQKIRLLSMSRFVQSSGGVLLQLSLGLAGFGLVGLVLGQTLGWMLGTATLIGTTSASRLFSPSAMSLRQTLHMVRSNKTYTVYDSVATATSIASNYLPTFLIATMFGTVMGGHYYMASRIMVLPAAVVANSLSQYIASQFVKWHEEGVFARNIVLVAQGLTTMTLVPFLSFGLFSEPVFSFVLGKQWGVSGQIAGWCGLWMGLKFVFESLRLSLSLLSLQKTAMCIQCSLLVVLLIVILGGSMFLAPLQVIALFCMANTGIYLVGLIFISSLGSDHLLWFGITSRYFGIILLISPMYFVSHYMSLAGQWAMVCLVTYMFCIFLLWLAESIRTINRLRRHFAA